MQGALDWHLAPQPVLQAAVDAQEKATAQGQEIGAIAIREAVRAHVVKFTLPAGH